MQRGGAVVVASLGAVEELSIWMMWRGALKAFGGGGEQADVDVGVLGGLPSVQNLALGMVGREYSPWTS